MPSFKRDIHRRSSPRFLERKGKTFRQCEIKMKIGADRQRCWNSNDFDIRWKEGYKNEIRFFETGDKSPVCFGALGREGMCEIRAGGGCYRENPLCGGSGRVDGSQSGRRRSKGNQSGVEHL
ncbi:hypothetical protein AVEN_254520-1 [Araneus ventricosus]|uniref:Uncharacterized protein n=1 Tax=Araneus ventricosus TaxID=182803 RepID=A0A4Y2V941_ARAVE|nr:hypothetical protein AVEN_254520-1 [Araneus ventricosus]